MFSDSLKRKLSFMLFSVKINEDEGINLEFLAKSTEFVRRNECRDITSIFDEENS